MAKTYCVNCGEAVEGAFCGTCGTVVEGAAQTSAPQQTFSAPTFSAPPASTVSGQVSFGQAITLYFKNYANFNGRSTPSAFWYALMFNFIVGIVAGWVDSALQIGSSFGFIFPIPVFQGIVLLGLLVPGIALVVRRLHDTGRSGNYVFFALIPFVGPILLLVWVAAQSEPADNRFGPRP